MSKVGLKFVMSREILLQEPEFPNDEAYTREDHLHKTCAVVISSSTRTVVDFNDGM